jgi:succinate dehydrogenase / fumarate reductase flavoprotein subunit
MRRYVNDVPEPEPAGDFEKDAADTISGLMARDGKEKIGRIQAEMQEVMMDNVSVFRQAQGLDTALDKISELKARYHHIALVDKGSCFNRDLLDALELGYMLDLAEAIAMGALHREESRGAHSREDFPERNDEEFLHHSMIRYSEKEPTVFEKPVTITRFQPKERKY